MSATKYVVQMDGWTCEGCSGAAERLLKRNEKNSDVSTDLKEQKVYVTSTLSQEEVTEILKKTGKTVVSVATA